MLQRHSYCAVIVVCAFLVLACASGQRAFAVSLLTNGGFESGNLTGWTTDEWPGATGTGSWYAASGTTTPMNGFPTPGPSSGSWYGVTDQAGADAFALWQPFTVSSGGYVTVNWDMFIENNDDGINAIDTSGTSDLDPTVANWNEHCRVDILTNGSDPFATSAATGVVQNLYLGGTGSNGNPWLSYTSGPLNLAPGTYMLRFGEVANTGPLNMGIDNVSADQQPVPEPGTLACLALGLLGLVEMKRRRRRV